MKVGSHAVGRQGTWSLEAVDAWGLLKIPKVIKTRQQNIKVTKLAQLRQDQ